MRGSCSWTKSAICLWALRRSYFVPFRIRKFSGSVLFRPRKVNVRVIAATHQDLGTEILEKRFREDLYYRLTMVEIRTPPVAERIGDLPLLIRHYVKHFSRQYRKSIS